MDIRELQRQIAYLESVNDQLESELSQLDALLSQVGFSQGIASVKAAVTELLAQEVVEEE